MSGDNLIIQLVPFLIWIALTLVSTIKLLRRTGIHVSVAAFSLFPFLGLIVVVWIVAYSKWPKVSDAKAASVF